MEPIVNKQARANYEFLESWEAGLLLTGGETKAAKKGQVNLTGSYVGFENGELWLKHAHISAYQKKNQPGYEENRDRKLLLHRKEIDSITGKLLTKGLTLIPEKVYSSHGILKIRIALARGLQKHDKRAKIKKRETDRSISRLLKEER